MALGLAGVLVVNIFVSDRLTSQVSDQVHASLAAALHDPAKALASRGSPQFQDPGGRYGLGIYGSPILFWQVSGGRVVRSSAGAPPLPAAGFDADTSTLRVGSAPFLVAGRRDALGILVAGESLAELEHVRSVLEISELLALPLLGVVAFLGALAIGIRSVVPVEEARRRQLEFTADASHELRTPLSVIEAEIALARSSPSGGEPSAGDGERPAGDGERPASDGEPSAAGAGAGGSGSLGTALDHIRSESRRLTTIVEDLLWLARFDAEPPPPGHEPIDLATIAAGCAGRFVPVAASKDVTLSVLAPSDHSAAAPLVKAPAEWVDRLVGVLVDNACKYCGSPGTVRLRVDTEGNRALLRVEDSGPGIPMEQRNELFDRFRRLDAAGRGHGLGLAIADSIVRSTGGRWRIATSELGGALMEVSWPVAR